MYLLDSNAWIVHFRSKGIGKLSSKLLLIPKPQIVTCSVVRAELMTGAFKSVSPAQGIAQIRSVLDPLQSFPFENRAAEVYGKIRAELEAKGMTIGANDFMIAAIALENDLTVVTHNTREFSRVASLRLEDWQ